MGARLRRLRHAPDLDTLRPDPLARRAPRCAWPTCSGRTARRSSPRRARSCAASSRGSPSAAGRRPRAPSSSSWSSATPTRTRGRRATATSSPANLYNVDYSMLGTARVEPLIRRIRNAMTRRGHAGRELQGRVQPRPARDQLPLRRRRCRPPTTTRSTRTAPRRSPPRRACRSPTWPSSTSSRATRATSISRCAGQDGVAAVRRRARDLRPLRGRPARLHARADAALRAPRQLLQALRRGLVRARPPWRGATTTAPARCASSATGRPSASSRACPGADVNPYLALRAMIAAGLHGIDERARARARRSRATPTSPTSRACRATLRDARDLFAGSEVARAAFGEDVVDHYLNNARVELAAFEAAGHRLGALPRLRAALSVDASARPSASPRRWRR